MAAYYSLKNELANAINSEKQALRYDPENSIIKEQLATFYNNYGLRYASSKEYNSAMDNLGYALDYSPDSKPLSKNLYNVMLQYADSSQKEEKLSQGTTPLKRRYRALPGYAISSCLYG